MLPRTSHLSIHPAVLCATDQLHTCLRSTRNRHGTAKKAVLCHSTAHIPFVTGRLHLGPHCHCHWHRRWEKDLTETYFMYHCRQNHSYRHSAKATGYSAFFNSERGLSLLRVHPPLGSPAFQEVDHRTKTGKATRLIPDGACQHPFSVSDLLCDDRREGGHPL